MMRRIHGVLAVGALVAGCKDSIDLDPVDDTPPVEARVRPRPISGGTLAIASGLAVASDPDRDKIHIADLDARVKRHTIELAEGDDPGRVVAGEDGTAYVVLRGWGGIAVVDLDAGEIAARHRTCADPRGVAYDAARGSIHVACASGSVVELAATDGAVKSRTQLEPDLRDVFLVDGEVKVSTFRSASILGLDGSRISIPRLEAFADPFAEEPNVRVPHVAWRSGVTPDGAIFVLHQVATTDPVEIEVEPEDLPGGDGGLGGAYGGGGGLSCDGAITNPALTLLVGGTATTSLLEPKLTVDVAFSRDGLTAIAAPGAGPNNATLETFVGEPKLPCLPEDPSFFAGEGQVTAVAMTDAGWLVSQSREPAWLIVDDDAGERRFIRLDDEPRFDTGHEIFHRVTDSRLSCASCHPEGTDDGHTWTFVDLGPRRTQALDIGLAGTEPFHWDGDMNDLDMIMGEVLTHRMGGKRQSAERRASFQTWLFDQERAPAGDGDGDEAEVTRGSDLFTSYGCATCHAGPGLGGTNTERFGDLDLQVPSLRRIALRAPYMHDGRSPTLADAVRDMVEGSGRGKAPDADVDAMVAYLRTL